MKSSRKNDLAPLLGSSFARTAIAASVIAASLSLLIGPTASASVTLPTITYTGVVRKTGGGSPLSATFMQPDPCLGGSNTLELTTTSPSFTESVPPSLQNGGYSGFNVPALKAGILPNCGNITFFEIFYSTSGAQNADPGIKAVMQTADGIYHLTNPDVRDFAFATNNGRTMWAYYTNAGYTPALSTTNPGGQVATKVAVMFWGNPNVQQINEILPPASSISGLGGYYFIAGTTGCLINDNGQYMPGMPGGDQGVFSVRATPVDAKFNFELSSGNN